MRISYEQDFFSSPKDSLKLFYRNYLVSKEFHRGDVVFLHGALEHSGRYHFLTKALTSAGFNCFGFDMRGHGKSEGRKGDAESFEILLEDLNGFIKFLETRFQVKKPLLLGHSLGGLIVLSYSLKKEFQNRIRGVYASAPALCVRLTIPMQIKQAIGKHLLMKLSPRLRLPLRLDKKYISHDSKEVDRYENDPLVGENMSVRLALGILKQGEKILKGGAHLEKLPFFLAHGDEDGISFAEGTRSFYKKMHTPQKNQILKLYPGYYHELFNEPKEMRELVFKDLTYFANSLY